MFLLCHFPEHVISEKLQQRNQVRKVSHIMFKPENSVDESFEDLLSKYKQIQIELECIRKEETMALEPDDSPIGEEEIPDHSASITETKPVPEPTLGPEDTSELDPAEKKVFQAFNIKPLRQKLPVAIILEESDAGDGAVEGEQKQGLPPNDTH